MADDQTNHYQGDATVDALKTAIDPVCGMKVDPAASTHRFDHNGRTFRFCCARCREKFAADPDAYLQPAPPPVPAADSHLAARAVSADAHIHLSDASRDPAIGPRKLPALRHGARAGGDHRRCTGQS